jgi:hypothetical protein
MTVMLSTREQIDDGTPHMLIMEPDTQNSLHPDWTLAYIYK